ncbi:MAG TPA: metal ABC transporter substrate-binding protein [Candidatus Eisenbacteria bacterium]|nr:metal ABC transporter substrate-binding protein [Candidatus Eisenbacteria bacterium]
MIRRFGGLARFAGAAILALGFLAPGARIPVFQEDPVAEVGRAHAGGKLAVVTTTQDLASIAAEIGGDRIDVESLAKGYQDPHFVDAKPSYLVKLRKADLFIEVGRELEIGWAPGLINNARNSKIQTGGAGFLDASANVKILELGAKVGREQGDVHPLGNPHYWLDPANGLVVAANIRDALSRLTPGDAPYYRQRYAAFEAKLTAKLEAWKKTAASLGLTGMNVVTYHRSWPYFAEAFGLNVVDYVEPRPGVPPAPKHVQDLIAAMKSEKVGLLIVEPYFDPKLSQQIARNAGVPMVVLPPSVGAVPQATDYLTLFDTQLDLIRKALTGGKS